MAEFKNDAHHLRRKNAKPRKFTVRNNATKKIAVFERNDWRPKSDQSIERTNAESRSRIEIRQVLRTVCRQLCTPAKSILAEEKNFHDRMYGIYSEFDMKQRSCPCGACLVFAGHTRCRLDIRPVISVHHIGNKKLTSTSIEHNATLIDS